MSNKLISVVILLCLCFASGCQSKPAETTPASSPQPSSQTEQKPAEPSQSARANVEQPNAAPPEGTPASQQGKEKGAAAEGASSQNRAESQTSTSAQSGSATPQEPSAKVEKAPAQPIILTGAPMGGVRFDHAKHSVACETCHHSPRDPKRGSTTIVACTSCHTKPPQPGMKTGKQAAFHNPSATAGTCIDCHKNSGAPAPTRCAQCHKKENA